MGGRDFLRALIKKSALRGEQIHVLGSEVSEEEFPEGFDSNINGRVVYYDLFRDPLNWSKNGEAFPGGALGALRAMCRTADRRPLTTALDSLRWLLLHFPCNTACQTLRVLHDHQDSCCGESSPADRVAVLGLPPEALHGPGPLGALRSLAQIGVTLGGIVNQASARIFYPKPRHRRTHQTPQFSILTSAWISNKDLCAESQPHPDPHTFLVDPTAHLTFNLCLSEKERERRDSLTLPFQFSSEKPQARLHSEPGQASIHILYEPGAYDDLDRGDPDDAWDI